MVPDTVKKHAPVVVLASLVVALVVATIVGRLSFDLHTVPVMGVPATSDPALNLDKSRQLITLLAPVTLLVAFVVGRFRKSIPTALALVVDLLPLIWVFLFVLSLVHNASELMPARKHPLFNRNALASAGIATFVAALLPRRVRGAGAGVIALLLSILAGCDILHMRAFGNVIPVGSHGSFTQLWDVRASVASLFEPRDLWMAFYVVTATSMIVLFRVKIIENLRAVRVVAYVIPAAALSYFVGPIHADVATFLASTWSTEVLNREDQVWNAGIFEAHIREISVNVKNSLARKRPTRAELDDVGAYYRDEHAEHSTAARASFGQDKGKNLLVLQLEAFEEWLIDAQVNGQEVTPFLNRLKKRGIFYPHIIDIAAMSHTADCEYLVLNSNHPLPDGAVAFRAEANHFVTLATKLRDTGYSTLSMHGYRHGMWNRAVLHPRYGFTHSLFAEELGDYPKVGWGLDDHAFFDALAVAANKERAPWFLYAITLSSHHPYNAIPYNQRRLHLGALENTMVGNYMQSASFVDDALEKLFAKLEAQGLLRDTVVALYGDHAALLHTSQRERTALEVATNLPHETADHIGTGSINRVPLLIVLPQSDTPKTARVYGAQIDIAPTLLHYLGVEPPRSFMGHALLPEDVGGFVARWDGSFVSPPLVYDAGLNDCRVISDLRALPDTSCRDVATRARKQLAMSWLVTNDDLARWLVEEAKPLPPARPWEGAVTLGGGCQEDNDCAGPEGFATRCLGGLCVTDPHGECEREGSTAPCPLGSACHGMGSNRDVCSADCDAFACAGRCNDAGLCVSGE